MSFAFFDRHRLLRFFLCVIICAVLICLPLFRVQAIAGVDDVLIACFILQTVLVSLGWNMALDPDGTSAMVNEMLGDINEVCSAPLANIAAMIESTWDGHSPYVQVGLAYGDFAMITTAVSTWLAEHMQNDPAYPDDVAPVIAYEQKDMSKFISSKAVHFASRDAMFAWYESVPSRDAVIEKLGDSIVYRGNATRSYPTLKTLTGNTSYAAYIANCKSFKGNGSHVSIREVSSQGLTLPSSCGYCKRFYGANEGIAYLAYIESERRYYLNVGLFAGQDALDDEYDYYSLDREVLGVVPSNMLDIPVAGSISSTIALPYEQDEDYTDGAVVSGWGSLIDKVGDVASTLPFNVPMTGEAAAAATPAIVLPKDIVLDDAPAIDVPGDGTIELPKIGDLTLPVSIIKKFPFCIPFDLVNGLKVLSSPPKEPRFVIPLKYSNIIDEEIVIDFSKFGFVIRLVRWFEVLIFTVGLAAATRQFIKW